MGAACPLLTRVHSASEGGSGASGAVGGSLTGLGPGSPHRNAEVTESPAIARRSAVVTIEPVPVPVPVPLPVPVPTGVARGRARGPAVRTPNEPPSNVTSTVPSVSVRYVRPANSCSCSSVTAAGWPYGLPAPDETTATLGRTASRKSRVDAVPDPWWATFRRSTRGSPRARSSGSTPSSMSPARRNRRPATSPSSTIETLLIPVPVSLGRSGTRFASGQRTRRSMPSSASRSPVESRPRGGPPEPRTSDHAR